jgi:cardiolipin synthase
MKIKENIYNVTNLLSFYRLLAIPIIIYSLLVENRSLFIILICFNLISDILDRWIARKFKFCIFL